MKKVQAILLSSVMLLGLFAALPPVEASAYTDGDELREAVATRVGNAIMFIDADIEIEEPLTRSISGNISINLSGHKLTLNKGVEVENGQIGFEGAGEVIINGGITADGGEVIVYYGETSSTITGDLSATNGGEISGGHTVTGNVSATGENSLISIDSIIGNVSASGGGQVGSLFTIGNVSAAGKGSIVDVLDALNGSASATGGGTVNVFGDIASPGNVTADGGYVFVEGDIKGTLTVSNGALVLVHGQLPGTFSVDGNTFTNGSPTDTNVIETDFWGRGPYCWDEYSNSDSRVLKYTGSVPNTTPAPAEPAPTSAPRPTATPMPTPTLESAPDVVAEDLAEAAEAVIDEIAVSTGGTVTIEIAESGNTTLPVDILQAARENDVTLEITLPSGLTVTIDPETITENAVAVDLNLDIIYADTATEVGNAKVPANSVVILPSAHGQFGFEVSFTISAEELAANGLHGNNVKLYHVDSFGNVTQAGKLRLNADGSVTITISHASAYILTADEVVSADPLTAFVTNLYTSGLGRAPSASEVAIWVSRIEGSAYTGKEAAEEFYLGTEMKVKRAAGMTDEAFVTALYGGMLGRTPDANGYAAWVSRLNLGMSDENVWSGFAGSAEFEGIQAGFGN